MSAAIVSRTESTVTVSVQIPISGPMLDAEESIQRALNEAGRLATHELLTRFDTDGSNIEMGGIVFYPHSKKEAKAFQTPYGEINVERYVYQTSQGGKRYVPLDADARIVRTSTPKFAKMVTSKYACDGAPGVQRDLSDNHNREVALSFIKNLSDYVGTIAIEKEESWTYKLPRLEKSVATIVVGLDGTCLNMRSDGWREAMCGTIAFFDSEGNRLHTTYTAARPEYGKEVFYNRLEMEIQRAKEAKRHSQKLEHSDSLMVQLQTGNF